MSRRCSYCDSLETRWSADESIWRCNTCDRSLLPESGDTGSAAASPEAQPVQRIERVSGPRSAPGEGGQLLAAASGLALSLVFYGVLRVVPESMLTELFTQRGWVPYVIVGISSWALCLLGAKLIRLRAEARALERPLIETPPGGRLRPADAAATLTRLAAQPPEVRESFLVSRLSRALHHFEARRSVVEVAEFLSAESRADDLRVDASYGLVRVFVWAVPTLGFIGTVIGIGAAVGGFSATLEAASSLESMKESIGTVTGGLGVAFDTTLLALVMSMLIMFPANAVQRIEERLLGQIDDYCTEYLLQQLEDDPSVESDSALIDALAERLVRSFALRESGTTGS